MPRKPKLQVSEEQCRYLLRVELKDVKPTIWRQIWVESQMSLIQLHHIFQLAMGWTDAHLHSFTIHRITYATPRPEDGPDRIVVDERLIRLQMILKPSLEFEYLYDFGDNWRHVVRVEKTEPMDEPQGAAFVEAGAGACPPEDCGGTPGYETVLDHLRNDPEGTDARDFLRWAGEDFDPNRFDRRAEIGRAHV